MSPHKWHVPTVIPTEVDWARLAAFIDGEGSIGIRRRKGISKSPCYVATVVIANTEHSLIIWLKRTFQVGAISVRSPQKYYDGRNHRYGYIWEVQSKAAVWLLKNCFPYFVIKSSQAELCFELDETMSKERGYKIVVPEETLKRREEIKQKLHALKATHLPLMNWKEAV